MITIEIITDHLCEPETIAILHNECYYNKPVKFEVWHADVKSSKSKRESRRVISKYAVTKLPFVLLIDDELPKDEQEYAAVYSESGPITIDRINEKL